LIDVIVEESALPIVLEDTPVLADRGGSARLTVVEAAAVALEVAFFAGAEAAAFSDFATFLAWGGSTAPVSLLENFWFGLVAVAVAFVALDTSLAGGTFTEAAAFLFVEAEAFFNAGVFSAGVGPFVASGFVQQLEEGSVGGQAIASFSVFRLVVFGDLAEGVTSSCVGLL